MSIKMQAVRPDQAWPHLVLLSLLLLDPVDARRRVVQALRLHYLTLLSNPLWIFKQHGAQLVFNMYVLPLISDRRRPTNSAIFFGRIFLRVKPAVLAEVVLHKETERLNRTGGSKISGGFVGGRIRGFGRCQPGTRYSSFVW
jgi:hypothetical protein